MHINNHFFLREMTGEKNSTRILRSGECRSEELPILHEHRMDVYINEIHTMRLVCTGDHLPELVAGRLLTEGIIRNTDEINSIYICKDGYTARIFLAQEPTAPVSAEVPAAESVPATPDGTEFPAAESVPTVPENAESIAEEPTCCTGNRILTGKFTRYADLSALPSAHWEPEWIFALADRFRDGMPVYDKTFATHSCFLARGKKLLFACEDIGRHNALDKAVGYALLQKIPREECILYTSGRIPVDMAEKAIRSGIPVLAGKASPTVEAIELARTYNLTLISGARPDQMRLWHDGSKTQ